MDWQCDNKPNAITLHKIAPEINHRTTAKLLVSLILTHSLWIAYGEVIYLAEMVQDQNYEPSNKNCTHE